ncbi:MULTISPECIES: hypothetical protein [Levilactobacillus]|uniref:hypothetical protein n=1 Tax=Levilactobacillus TaxID=2767886 RepID=UPI001950B784|nr:hypothetical protein [Levilactobacillus sp. 244-2]
MRVTQWGLGLVGFIVAMGIGANGVAHADADLDNALNTAPQGIKIQDASDSSANIFTPGTAWSKQKFNQSKVVDVPESAGVSGTQAVEVTNGAGQSGAIWSTDNNPFPLNSKHVQETASMWMYFGNKQSAGTAGEGMAFVLQNDSNGLAATTKYQTAFLTGTPTIQGESLGVWGASYFGNISPDAVAKTAIQHSWAMEFDTEANKAANNAADFSNSFDNIASVSGAHIAWNYPSDSKTYIADSSISSPNMLHRGIVNNLSLSDGKWHHITLTWNGYNTMTYTIDDKDPQTGEALKGQGADFGLDPGGQVGGGNDPTTITTTDSGETRWGFTGTTDSSKWENNLVIFEQVPGLVNATATNTLTDVTTGKDIASGDKVKSDDKVKLTYNLGYVNGRQDWKNIVAKLSLPRDLTFSQATVSYGATQVATLTGDNLTSQLAKYTLPQDLSSSNTKASITLQGTADDVTKETTVPATTSNFDGTNDILSTDTVPFTLTPNRLISIHKLSGDPVNVQPNQDTKVIGTVGMSNIPDDYDYRNVTVTGTLNGKTLTTQPDDEGEFNFTIPAADLTSGSNSLTVKATDEEGNSSDAATWTLNMGVLQLANVSDQAKFTTKLTGSAQDVEPDAGWTINVVDTRGTGSAWTLQANATAQATTPDGQLSGNLVYKRQNGTEVTLNQTPQTVMTHTNTATDTGTTDVTSSWGQKAGMQAQINSDAIVGDYTIVVGWQLIDGVS